MMTREALISITILALVIGLLVFFLGPAVLALFRNEKDAKRAKARKAQRLNNPRQALKQRGFVSAYRPVKMKVGTIGELDMEEEFEFVSHQSLLVGDLIALCVGHPSYGAPPYGTAVIIRADGSYYARRTS